MKEILRILASAKVRIRSVLEENNRLIAIVSFACVAIGVALSQLIEPGVHVQTVTLAADTPALKFIPAGSGPHPVALLAHGYTASKEPLFRYGEALAAAGFECYDVDQPGHGASPRAYSFMAAVRTLEAVAHEIGPVDVFIGHSMGGFSGGEAVREGGLKTKLFIALGSLPVLGKHGPPLLLLAGEKDEYFRPSMLKARTDARFVLSPWSDHALELYDPVLVNAAVEAACRSVGKTPPAPPTRWRWRLVGLVLAMLGALGLAFCLPKLRPPWAWGRGLLTSTIFIVIFVLSTQTWLDTMPHLRYFFAQGAAITVILLVLLGLGRLRVPGWAFTTVAAAAWLSVIAIPSFHSMLMAHAPHFALIFIAVFMPALLAGTLLGRMTAHHGSRFDGDVALAIIMGCALFQWGRPPRMLPPPTTSPVAINLNAKQLGAYVGQYEFAPDNVFWRGMKLTTWLHGNQLMGRAAVAGQSYGLFKIYPESVTNFFDKVWGTQWVFIRNDKGEVTAVIHRFPGLPDSDGKKLLKVAR